MTSPVTPKRITNNLRQSPDLSSSPWLQVFLLVILAVPLFGWGSATIPLTGPDEPRYAAIANEMMQTGDYVTPRLAGKPWFEKPALTYWLMAASYRVFGVNEFGARFPSILMALLSVLILFYTVRRLVSERTGLLAALALECSIGFIIFSRAASTDMILTSTVTLALCAFLLSEQEQFRGSLLSRRSFWLAVFYASIGLTMLAKGLAGIALSGGVIGSYLLISRRLRDFIGLHLIWGGLLAFAISSIWYGPVIARHGYAFVDEFFVQHHFQRFTTNKYHHPGPFYYYVLAIVIAVFPFSFLLPISAARIPVAQYVRNGIDAIDRWKLFAFLWMVFPVIFFSFSGSKLPGYILPAVPGAALLVASDLKEIWSGDGKRSQFAGLTITAILMIAGALALPFLKKIDIELPMRIGIAVILIVGGLTVALGSLRRSRTALAGLFATMVILIPIAGAAVRPQLIERQSIKPLALTAKQNRRSNEPIMFLGDLPRIVHGFTFYTDGAVTYDEDNHGSSVDQVLGETISNHSLLCVMQEAQLAILSGKKEISTEVLGRQRGIVLVRLTAVSEQWWN
jgi:4-amino-4-deoxy-L-arabinose transferase-like glycosyltransferase